jgi:hypothetical protein
MMPGRVSEGSAAMVQPLNPFTIMGRQRGVVHLSGQYDDTRMAIDGEMGIAYLADKITKEQVQNDPRFALTRNVNAEFKGASKGADSVQQCLANLNSRFGDRYCRARLLTKMIQMVRKGAGDHGKRSLEVMANASLLKAFELNRKEGLKMWLKVPYTVTVNADRNTAVVDVPTFVANNDLVPPKSSTHFRITVCVGVLSDFMHVGGDAAYEAVNPGLNGEYGISYSAFTPVTGTVNTFQVMAALPSLAVLPATAGLVVSIGIEFFLECNNVHLLQSAGNAMRIEQVS